MKYYNLLSALVLVFLCSSCGESEVNMMYQETYCADPWTNNSGLTDEELEIAVENYLSNVDIHVTNLNVSEGGELQPCNACSCTNNRQIRLTADEEDQKALEDLNFVVE